ncbi:MaoC/PaaZ C-terminal domain-containing protein [Oceanobacillus sp. CF4.6]|uniref:MaoC/PaaZ C-terminal domain-containing protein n=1 Tax=Oceanobacillus sp. CF4.6 TaxID=3373080 RepID=UPI003EE50FA6
MKFNEFTKGDIFTTSEVIVDKGDMVEYAKKYDPQYFHVDEVEAKESPYESLIASGFYSINIVWANFIHMNILGRDCLGGLGIDNIRWKLPVKPNHRLVGEYTIVNKRILSDNNRGILDVEARIRNQDGQEAITFQTKILIKV